MRRGVGQHGKAVAEYTRFTEYRGGLSTAHLLECAVQLGGSTHVEAGVQLVVGVTGVQRLRHVAYRAVGRHIGIGVFSHGDVNVAVGILATLGVPDDGSGLNRACVGQVAALNHVVKADGGVGGTCGEPGVNFHTVHAGIADHQFTGATISAGADHVARQVVGGR